MVDRRDHPFLERRMSSMSQAVVAGRDALRAAMPYLELGQEVCADGGWTTIGARRLDEDRSVVVRTGPAANCSLGKDAAQIAGVIARLKKLEHPGLAIVENGGVAGGDAYLELAGVRGQPIGEFFAQRRLSIKQSLELGALVCDALAYLHEQGIGYGAVLPSGAWVSRRAGSLRMAAKLVQLERVRKFVGDGGDQRAAGAVLLQLAGMAGQREGAVRLRKLGESCARATGDAPRMKEVAAELRALAAGKVGGRRSSAARHQAEALAVGAPKAGKAAGATSNSTEVVSQGTKALTGSVVVVGIVMGALSGFLKDRAREDRFNQLPPTSNLTQPAPQMPGVPSWAQHAPSQPTPPSPGVTPETQLDFGVWSGRPTVPTSSNEFDRLRPQIEAGRPPMPGGFPTPRRVPVGPPTPTPGMPGSRFGAPTYPSGASPGFTPGGGGYTPPSPGFGAGS
jgi:hypothetical protein